jgi:PAS domain S-box-containing protein
LEFRELGEAGGTLVVDGEREVEFRIKPNVLPKRHLLSLEAGLAPWAEDYALSIVNLEGDIVAWYAGSERIYGYKEGEAKGQDLCFLYPAEDGIEARVQEELRQAVRQGYKAEESWQARVDGSRFWANCITIPLKDAEGQMHGFARVVRDFSERYKIAEEKRISEAVLAMEGKEGMLAGFASGVEHSIPEVNDVLLELLGYTREDLNEGRLKWAELTPPEYVVIEELAHEESLLHGACTPFEKEMIRQDGTKIRVIATTAILGLTPFRWICIVQPAPKLEAVEALERKPMPLTARFQEIIGKSSALERVQHQVTVVAPTDATVLILGETGTGKELVARAVHQNSPRSKMPFVTLNCAAIPTGLLESELFGYERGAFTGALSLKIGRFEMANHGTLFLDEVGDIPIDLQPKLLRALQEKSFERLGGTKTIPIDVRLVAATNRDLNQMMSDKLFRSDLYYRLKVFPIKTPSLRERPEDIPLLARHFIQKYAEKMNRRIEEIPTNTMKALSAWKWPGNVRELENFIERAVILTPGRTLLAPIEELGEGTHEAVADGTLEEMERGYILKVLRECSGVISTAATRLGLPRTTLNAMMKKLGISRKEL